MATKKVTKKEVVAEILISAPVTPKVAKGVCPFCVNGRIPQKVEWHYVSCGHCNGTAIA